MDVGNTPLIEIDGIFTKLECTNPCGSIKDRIAVFILEKSRESGALRPGQQIVEATSGNTGIALAYFGRRFGHPVTIVMPENMTEERKKILERLGAELILVSKEGSFAEAARVRDRIAAETGAFNTDQFSNPLNTRCHYETTGTELVEQLAARGVGKVDAFVAGVGTGGSLMGVGSRLAAAFPDVAIVAVEPAESAVMSGGAPGPHGIYGIGDGFIPALVTNGAGGLSGTIGEVVCVESDVAKATARYLADECGCCVGISSGANFEAARRLRERFGTVATLFPDGFQKYESEGLHHCQASCPYEHRLATADV